MDPLDAAALEPPEGMDSNFDNPPNQNALAIGVLSTCAVISTTCLLLRGYGRVYLLRKVQTEEILAVLAYGCYWGAAVSTFKLIETPGYFVDQWNIRMRDLIPTSYWVFIFGVCYSFVLPFLKIAILVEWCRFFVPRGNRTSNPFWWGCVTIIFVQVTANIAIILALCFQCTPHTKIWDFTVDGQCFDLFHLQVSSASIHLASDFAMLLLPQRIIWSLKMSWKKRLGVSVVFSLGLLACVSAAFRLAVTVDYGNATNQIPKVGPLLFWATAEMACGFFIVCIPCIPKILRDSGVLRKIKSAFGFKSAGTTDPKSGKPPGYGQASTNGTKLTNTATGSNNNNNYYKLDEEAMAMDNLGAKTESTEHLHDRDIGMAATTKNGITRTTRVVVTEDSRSMGDNSDGSMYMHGKEAWAR